MVKFGGWRCLALVTLLGFFLAASVPIAAAPERENRASVFSSLNVTKLPGGVYYNKLEDFDVYLLKDEEPHVTAPACVIISSPSNKWNSRRAFEEVVARFCRVYRLQGYKTSYAEDGSAAFLMRENPQEHRRNLIKPYFFERQMMPVIIWLNQSFKGVPKRVEGTRLIWSGTEKPRQIISGAPPRRMNVVTNNNAPLVAGGTLEVALDLLCADHLYLELRPENIEPERLNMVVADMISLRLPATPRNKTNVLRRQLGCKPLCYGESRELVGRKRRLVAFCIVECKDKPGCYVLSCAASIKKMYDDAWVEPTLPEVEPARWLDEAEAPAPAEEPAAPVAEENPAAPPAPAEEPRAVAPEPIAMPTPAEARKAYSERLKAL